MNRTFTALVICEKGNEEGGGDNPNASAFPHLYNTALFLPEGQSMHTFIHGNAHGLMLDFSLLETYTFTNKDTTHTQVPKHTHTHTAK